MKYSKQYLDTLQFNSSEHRSAIQDLLFRAKNQEKLTYAESEFVFNLTQLLQGETPKDKLDHKSFDCCKKPYFIHLYLIYSGNLSGGKPAFDFNGLISIERKNLEIKELEVEYKNWLPNLSKFNHKNGLMNLIASEANNEIKELNKLAKKEYWGSNLLNSKIKAISLHSKFVYISVESMFEESQSDSINVTCGGKEVVIDKNSIVHIFWRHYAGITKQYDTNKSFHLDFKIKHFEIPVELASVLKKIGALITINEDTNFLIPVKIRETIYSIWTKKVKESIKGKGLVEVIKLQTFYPTKNREELQRVNDEYIEIIIDDELSVFKEKNSLQS
ncbi:MAG: hypothetical protein WD555_03635 [Fulvivirga sp.]